MPTFARRAVTVTVWDLELALDVLHGVESGTAATRLRMRGDEFVQRRIAGGRRAG